MWVIVDWTDTQIIGVFNSKEYAEVWLQTYWEKHSKFADEAYPGMDRLECSIHKIINATDATIRVDA